MKKYKWWYMIMIALCVSCMSTQPIATMKSQPVIVKRIYSVDGDETIVKVRELDRRAGYFMKTRLNVSRFDTLLATPGIDYKYARWY